MLYSTRCQYLPSVIAGKDTGRAWLSYSSGTHFLFGRKPTRKPNSPAQCKKSPISILLLYYCEIQHQMINTTVLFTKFRTLQYSQCWLFVVCLLTTWKCQTSLHCVFHWEWINRHWDLSGAIWDSSSMWKSLQVPQGPSFGLLFSSPQRFSKGFWSRDWVGCVNSLILWLFNHFCVDLDHCVVLDYCPAGGSNHDPVSDLEAARNSFKISGSFKNPWIHPYRIHFWRENHWKQHAWYCE